MASVKALSAYKMAKRIYNQEDNVYDKIVIVNHTSITYENGYEPKYDMGEARIRQFAVTIRHSFLLLLSAGISLKTWLCSRKTQAGRRVSQTGNQARSAR